MSFDEAQKKDFKVFILTNSIDWLNYQNFHKKISLLLI